MRGGCLADLFAVASRPSALALRRVDDEGDVAAGDEVDGIDAMAVGDLPDHGIDIHPMPAGLSPSASDKNTVPAVGKTVPAASSAL